MNNSSYEIAYGKLDEIKAILEMPGELSFDTDTIGLYQNTSFALSDVHYPSRVFGIRVKTPPNHYCLVNIIVYDSLNQAFFDDYDYGIKRAKESPELTHLPDFVDNTLQNFRVRKLETAEE